MLRTKNQDENCRKHKRVTDALENKRPVSVIIGKSTREEVQQ